MHLKVDRKAGPWYIRGHKRSHVTYMRFFVSKKPMKKPSFFTFSLAHLTPLERVGWGALLILVMGFNVFATQVEAQASEEAELVAKTSEEVVEQPIVQEFLPEIGPRKPRRIYKSTLTAYTSRVEETDSTPFITANGSHVHMGTIAANCLPFGTKVQLPDLYGDQIFVVEDRLHPRKGCAVIDVWLPEYHQAIQFGKKYSTIYVL